MLPTLDSSTERYVNEDIDVFVFVLMRMFMASLRDNLRWLRRTTASTMKPHWMLDVFIILILINFWGRIVLDHAWADLDVYHPHDCSMV